MYAYTYLGYAEPQRDFVRGERGVDPRALYGDRGVRSLSAGARIRFGGRATRMGSCGALDSTSAARRPAARTSHDAHGTDRE